MAHDVFISHSAKDKTVADAVCAALESEGIRCWIAPRDVLPSMEWSEAIIDAIEQCRIMVLVFTANANASPQIRREVERAVNHGVAMLPVRIEDVLPGKGLEYFIGNVHWLDALSPPLDAHLKNLAGTIKLVLARHEPGAPTIAQAEEKPSSSSGRNFAEVIPEKASVQERAPAPRAFWSAKAWTWAAGTVSALLLGAFFVGTHFNSRSSPVASSPPAPVSGQAAPNPGMQGGITPSTQEASPMPATAPAQAVPKTVQPTGVVQSVPPSLLTQPSGNATSLPNAMMTFQAELGSAANMRFAILFQNKTDGSNIQQTRIVHITNVVADPAQCRVSYHREVWLNGSAQPSQNGDSWFLLRGVTRVAVEPLSQYLTQSNAASGQANIIASSTTPNVGAVIALYPGGYNQITVPDLATASRVGQTLAQAVRLCGGALTN